MITGSCSITEADQQQSWLYEKCTQAFGSVLDGYMRNTPDGKHFLEVALEQGVDTAIKERDRPFGDYSAASPDHKPNPAHVIMPEKGQSRSGDNGMTHSG